MNPIFPALATDLYELTMLKGYLDFGIHNDLSTFDLFIRSAPEDWSFFIVCGTEQALEYLCSIKFTDEDIEYLKSTRLFDDAFLDYLNNFSFTGDVWAVPEGTPIAPGTPILRVTAPRGQAQLVETSLLSIINYQTMVATKANRIVRAAQGAPVADFGLRRAHGIDAGIWGARASFIGGCVATSNVEAGKRFRIPLSGTHAHSWIMSFKDEDEAFKAYLRSFPSNSTLLIDTYDTKKGAVHAAKAAHEIQREGHTLGAVRIDSGDLERLSCEVRSILDNEGLSYVKIIVTNDLNEYRIERLSSSGNISAYGVGTEMITAKPVAALPGVYKLAQDVHGPKIKLSKDKVTFPGIKQVHRIVQDGMYQCDILALDGEDIKTDFESYRLLQPEILQGKRVNESKSVQDVQKYALNSVLKLPKSSLQIRQPDPYPLKISPGIETLMARLSGDINANGPV